jgi:glycosyltransferase involved in cell wall biosynthesis
MKRIHIVPGLGDVANGLAVIARLLAKEEGDADVVDLYANMREIHEKAVDEVWIHGMWQPREWIACSKVLRARKRLVRMTHGSLSPIYLKQRGRWKKWVVGPIERFFLRRADVVVATCEAEAEWIRQYEPRVKKIEVTDVKRFFDLSHKEHKERKGDGKLHLLYLGRRHPLKGLEFLEAAVREVEGCELRIVSNAFGEEKERVWEWCDVLVLPTLSENFGLVVAEALERGKRVITTDGAPAWGDGNDYGGRLVYLKGYRNGSSEERVRLLKNAIEGLQDESGSCLDSKSV